MNNGIQRRWSYRPPIEVDWVHYYNFLTFASLSPTKYYSSWSKPIQLKMMVFDGNTKRAVWYCSKERHHVVLVQPEKINQRVFPYILYYDCLFVKNNYYSIYLLLSFSCVIIIIFFFLLHLSFFISKKARSRSRLNFSISRSFDHSFFWNFIVCSLLNFLLW